MSPRKTILIAAAAVMLCGTRAFPAILADDVNAISGFHGTEDFSTAVPPLSMMAQVDYAVYAPGMFNASFPGSDPSSGLRYVYAYRVHNTGTPGNALERDPAFLSVGFDGGELPQNMGFVDLNIGDNPNASTLIPVSGPPYASATWNFTFPITETKYSEVLLFTSPFPPEFDDASVQGGGLATQKRLPSPVPEPGTALAACGMMAALLTRRRNSN